jgi:peptide/nickel transport system substrate-binding protein
MRKKRLVAATAAISAVVLAAAACGGGSGSSGGDSAAGYNAADTSIVNPQSGVGGTLNLEMSTTVDTLDPGATYESVTWDLYQLFDRTMMTYAQEPGAAGLKVVPDLVTSYTASNDNKTWTYHIQSGAKFSDGDPITTADVAYAIDRSNYDATDSVQGGPGYFAGLLTDTNNYQGPYKDPHGQVSGITTPNATTITFNLTQPFADFNYLMTLPETTPIEPSKDPRTNFSLSADISKESFSGQYEVQSFSTSSSNPGMVLVPNPDFDESTDPSHLHVRHASKIVVTEGVSSTTVDQDLLSGKTGLDIRGIGVEDATQNLVLSNPKYRADADDAETGAETFVAINTQIEPFNNINCRQAVEWAINKQQIQDVSGGQVGGGQIATTILPPNNSGYKESNLYATGGEEGDTAKAAALVNTCKEQEGSNFDGSFSLATYLPSDNPKFAADAAVVQQNLNAIGFNVSINEWGYSTTFFKDYAGDESYATSHRVGLSLWSWTADFPTGYGYMDELLTKDGIASTGGDSYNQSYWDSSTFDNLLSEALAAPTPAQTDSYYAQADQYAMSQAVMVPLLYDTSLFYRPPNTTNVMFSEPLGMYDYGLLGTTSTN